MVLFTILFGALIRVALSVAVIFFFIILPLTLVSRKAKLVRRYRSFKRTQAKANANNVTTNNNVGKVAS
ncbi:hypothetical protein CKF54_01015 [Psittacicella hinzii]|uniref:Uncharacterized protein n=1 Tax=Psittacicella hinzii TaxID=2028575 RepID=A0A3A1Y7U3_9GAMM|nr:hypothetical protein [Psittacicella hinzii]RIY34292.1 hypothetical protein CKF54_01015 [Psittacicella hinzii]